MWLTLYSTKNQWYDYYICFCAKSQMQSDKRENENRVKGVSHTRECKMKRRRKEE